MKIHAIIITFLFFLSSGCEREGINPDTYQEPGFSGTLTFSGPVPPSDSLLDLRIVAVPYYPVDSTFSELFDKIVSKAVIPFSENLKEKAVQGTSSEYRFSVKPQIYHYIAAVQQFGPDILRQWKVVGIYGYTSSHPSPLSIMVKDGEITSGTDIIVDFYHLPIQPFKVP